MLKGIPKLLSPELLQVLCSMGHSDRICIADGNFPAETIGKNAKVVRCDGLNIPELLDAILTVMPLDAYTDKPCTLMQLMDCDIGRVPTPIWDEYRQIVAKHDTRGEATIGNIDRFDFYEEAKSCYAIVTTTESAVYANIMLQKGVVIA